jgi:hypothetical protein
LEPYVASVVLADILPEREMPEQTPQSSYSGMAARIVAAYVRHHRLSPEQIAPPIPAVYGALLTTGVPENQGSDKLTPAVPVRPIHSERSFGLFGVRVCCPVASTALESRTWAHARSVSDQMEAIARLPDGLS